MRSFINIYLQLYMYLFDISTNNIDFKQMSGSRLQTKVTCG